MNKAPAYQMYAGDWLKSRSVRLMDDYQRGWYIQLLNEAWDGDPQCMLPKDDETLQRLAGVSDVVRDALNNGSTTVQPRFNRKWAEVRALFVDNGEYCYNKRQMEEYAKQRIFREKQSAKGESSAKKRKQDRIELDEAKNQILIESTTVQPRLLSGSTEIQPDDNREATLHLLSSSSSPSTYNPPIPPTVEDAAKPSRKERNAKERQAYDEEFSKAWVEIVNLTPNASKAPSAKAWASCRKAGLGVDDILGWYRAFAQDKTERRFVTGFHKIAEPVTIRAWMTASTGGPLGEQTTPIVSEDRLRRHLEKIQAQQQKQEARA